jgi:hypothetical protein
MPPDRGSRQPSHRILNKGCVCGHDHLTEREEPISLCLECNCVEERHRCQNCGGEAMYGRVGAFDVCSRRCELQLEFAASRAAA